MQKCCSKSNLRLPGAIKKLIKNAEVLFKIKSGAPWCYQKIHKKCRIFPRMIQSVIFGKKSKQKSSIVANKNENLGQWIYSHGIWHPVYKW